MTGLDYFSWLVLIVILVAAVVAVISLAQLPGKIAASRGHPDADAINIAGWLGIFTGVVWIIAMIWANTRTQSSSDTVRPAGNEEIEALRARVAELEAQLSTGRDTP